MQVVRERGTWKSRGALLLAVLVGMACHRKMEDKSVAPAPRVRIAITQIATHPGIDAVRLGFLDEMAREGYKPGVNVDYEMSNANGDFATAQAIAKRLAASNLTLLFSISTPSTQACLQAMKTSKTPIVFGAITDPVSAGVVKSMEHPGGNVTGTADIWPIDDQFALMRQLVPKARRVGVLFNPAESNSQHSMEMVRASAPKNGFEIVTTPVASSAEVPAAIRSLVSRVDTVYIPADNTVISAIAAVVSTCEQNHVPLMPGDTSNVEVGGFGTIGHDYRSVGAESAKIAVRVLHGEVAGNIPVGVSPVRAYFFNVRSAKAMGVTIPPDLLSKAAKVYQ